jgi:NADPH:quinone reductase-like Zn-dependent oxidoreductase
VNAGGIGILARLIQMLLLSRVTSQKLITFVAKPSKEDLTLLQELMAAGRLTPVIDKRYSLSEVSEAIRYLEEGQACGKVVTTLE